MGIKIRKEYNIKVNIDKNSEFIGCNPKGIYYIENNFELLFTSLLNKSVKSVI